MDATSLESAANTSFSDGRALRDCVVSSVPCSDLAGDADEVEVTIFPALEGTSVLCNRLKDLRKGTSDFRKLPYELSWLLNWRVICPLAARSMMEGSRYRMMVSFLVFFSTC